MTRFVTGGAGFIGANFLFYLRERYPDDRLVCIDKLTYAGNLSTLAPLLGQPNFRFAKVDICDREAVYALFAEERPDVVINFAAESHVDRSIADPSLFLQTNIIGTDNVLHAAIDAGVERVVCLSTDKAAYPINAMGISKAMMEHVIFANARVAAERGGTTICCTRYGNVMCSRGSVIPLFIDQIKAGNPITITDPNMTRFLMNLDEAVDLVMFAFEHANPGDLFIQKSDASTIGDLAKAVQQLFGDTGTNIIGTRHGEKLFETLMTREERLRSEDMGDYYRVAADNRDLNYDKFVVKGEVHTMADDSYTSHNTNRLDVEGTVKKILTTEYVRNALKEMEAEKKA